MKLKYVTGETSIWGWLAIDFCLSEKLYGLRDSSCHTFPMARMNDIKKVIFYPHCGFFIYKQQDGQEKEQMTDSRDTVTRNPNTFISFSSLLQHLQSPCLGNCSSQNKHVSSQIFTLSYGKTKIMRFPIKNNSNRHSLPKYKGFVGRVRKQAE